VGVAFTISGARPSRLVTRLGVIVPNERPAVFRALINSVAERDIGEQQKRTAKKEESSIHG
jgi:hypothetical protein